MNSWSEKSSIACNGFLLDTYIRINYQACTIYNNLGTLTHIHPIIPQPARPLNTPPWMSPKPFGFRDFTINFPSLDLPCTTLYFGLPHPGQARRGGVFQGTEVVQRGSHMESSCGSGAGRLIKRNMTRGAMNPASVGKATSPYARPCMNNSTW